MVYFVVICRWAGYSSAFARKGNDFARRSLSSLAATASVDDYDEFPQTFPVETMCWSLASKAVRKACQITNDLQPGTAMEGISTVEKSDMSPVTVGDFACQASVLHDLHMAFPEDSSIAEESSSALDDDAGLAQRIIAATALSDIEQVKQSVDLGHYPSTGKNEEQDHRASRSN